MIFDLEDVLTFGKYKGCVLKNVIKVNSGYVSWAKKNIKWFEITRAASDLLSATPCNRPWRPYRGGGSFYADNEDNDDYDYDDWIGCF